MLAASERRRPTSHHEDAEQAAVFDWARHIPALRYLHAIPNGGNRDPREAARLKRQGVKPGISDIFLPVPKGKYHGLYIEMKRAKKNGRAYPSQDQKDFMAYAREQGYAVALCYGADDAINVIRSYLAGLDI